MGKKDQDKKQDEKQGAAPAVANLTGVLDTFRRPDRTGWDDTWIGMEPTFQSEKTVKLWEKMSVDEAGEDKYFETDVMLGLERKVAEGIRDKYEKKRKDGEGYCMFSTVKLEEDKDQWGVARQNVEFHWPDSKLKPFTVRVSIDPETVEFSIKPVPLAWLYDDRFVRFLQNLVWEIPMKEVGLAPSVAHGGCQFSFSAKTFMGGSLLADSIAYRVNHPDVCLFLMDWPNPDDRALRATAKRLVAFREILEAYRAGAFHPQGDGKVGRNGPEIGTRHLFSPQLLPWVQGRMENRYMSPFRLQRHVFQARLCRRPGSTPRRSASRPPITAISTAAGGLRRTRPRA